ncbi:sensor histidine kinase [Mumia zhuanghuii]|uniref:Oxygen sensor histidine kinase NreB n=2 Tax=Mumia TaxID=1546255 RepID=A0ABW1QLS6_9ACTN|nr:MULTISPECIES: sensor histidine kinase [Mumia]KAA1419805.1 sensor histidine kinase [Mumia zhuanghuii]
MSELAVRVEQRWAVLQRRGPYALLALATVLAAMTAAPLGFVDQLPYVLALAALVAVGHWWCVDRRWDEGPLDDGLGHVYLAARTLAAFVMSWLNPFCAVFAFVAYFDATTYAKGRWIPVVLGITAVTMAGSQAGGFPPSGTTQTLVFLGLLALNLVLVLIFTAIARQETELADERVATIAELERTNARLEEAMQENAALQEALVTRAREAGIHEERERLAAEIHDTIAQGLAGIVTQLQAADEAYDDAAAAEHRKRAAELARASLDETRRSVEALSPAALEHLALVEAVRARVREWAAENGVRAEVVVTGEPETLSPAVEAVVLRVVQESLTNVARHAEASRVGITLSYTDDEIVLDVRDDGRGFDVRVTTPRGNRGGFGLDGMRRRAERAGGALIVESEPGGGTAVSLRVPSGCDV